MEAIAVERIVDRRWSATGLWRNHRNRPGRDRCGENTLPARYHNGPVPVGHPKISRRRFITRAALGLGKLSCLSQDMGIQRFLRSSTSLFPLYSAARWRHCCEDLLRTGPSRDDARWGRGWRSGCNILSLDLLSPHSMACTAGHEFLVFARQSHDAFNSSKALAVWASWHTDAAGTARRLTRELVVGQRIVLVDRLETLEAQQVQIPLVGEISLQRSYLPPQRNGA